MKSHSSSLLLAIFLLCIAPVYAQQELEIDFQDLNNAKLTETFNFNDKARVKIININRFIYKLTEETTSEDFNTTVPSILTSIALPSFFTSQLSNIGSPSISKKVDVNQPSNMLKNDYNDKLEDLIREWQEIDEAIDKHNKIVYISKDCNKSFLNIETEVKDILAKFLGENNSLPVANLADKLDSLIDNKIILSSNIFNDMEELLSAWKNQSLTEYRENQETDADILATLNSELKILQGKKPMDRDLVYEKEKEVRDQTRKIKEADEDYATEVKHNEVILEKAKTILGNINKYKEDGKYKQLGDDIRKVNESNYTYYSEMVTMKKDEYLFKISAISEQRLICNFPTEQKLEAVLRTKGGVKLDFSTGVFVMFGSDDFLGRNYYYKPVDETQSSISSADNSNRALLGIGALMHVYKRSPSNFKVGGAIGVSSSLNFDAVNFHLGPSFILGDKDRFSITVGITAREVDLLDNKYTLDRSYNTEDLPEEIPTFKMFPKFGSFFSFTYNFSQFNK